jgi:PAS domain S-box-containing protein
VNPGSPPPPGEPNEEVLALIATLHATGRRLEELTAGEVDTVADRDGRTFMLQGAQEQLRHIDAARQAASLHALAQSELRFRQLADNIRDVFFLQNLGSSQIYYVSPAYEEVWGRTCESLYARPASWAQAIHPEDLAASSAAFSAGRDTGFDHEFRIIRPDGGLRWIHVRGFPVLDGAGNPYRIAGIASDITQRKQAADELRESERRFSGLLANVEMVSLMLDTKARITYCNDYLLRLTGWRREEVLGRDWLEVFIPSEVADGLKKVHAALLAEKAETLHHENEILTRSGERRLIRWNNSVLRSATGEASGTASIGEDITERRMADEVLRKRAAELERFHRLSVGRELQMVELKKQVNELAKAAGQAPPHDLAFLGSQP